MSTYRLVSSDSHIIEPPNLWQDRIDPAYRDRGPRVVREEGWDQWYAESDVKFGSVGSDTQAGRRFDSPETIQKEGRYEDVRLGAIDPQQHVEDMDLDSVAGGVIYPSVGLGAYTIPSSDLLSAVFQSYNNWLADFCAPFPERLKGVAMINVDTVGDAVNELQRSKSIGLAGAMIPQRPLFGRYDSPVYERLWSTSEDLKMPLAIHIGTSRWHPGESTRQGTTQGPVVFTNQEYEMKDNIAAVIYSGVFERHPNLKIGLVEYEISWAPYLLYRMDRTYMELPGLFKGTRRFAGDMIPSDFFKRNVFISFQEDPVGIQMREYVGVQSLMWGSDYPHAESTFPRSREIVDRILEGVPPDEQAMIAGENAALLYNFK